MEIQANPEDSNFYGFSWYRQIFQNERDAFFRQLKLLALSLIHSTL